MGRPKKKVEKIKEKVKEKIKEFKEESKEFRKEIPTDELPSWAEHSTTDPKTGLHISQWKLEQMRKQQGGK